MKRKVSVCCSSLVVSGSPSFVKAQVGKGLAYTPAVTPGAGGSCVSVSNALGSSVGTVKANLFHALANLRREMTGTKERRS